MTLPRCNEIVHRRYKRLSEEELPFPDLIVIDGGKGQLGAACQALKDLGLYGDIPIIGIAKRLEEIYKPEDPYPLHIDKKSESLKLIQRGARRGPPLCDYFPPTEALQRRAEE